MILDLTIAYMNSKKHRDMNERLTPGFEPSASEVISQTASPKRLLVKSII